MDTDFLLQQMTASALAMKLFLESDEPDAYEAADKAVHMICPDLGGYDLVGMVEGVAETVLDVLNREQR